MTGYREWEPAWAELARRLWGEGISATGVAAELAVRFPGCGISRGAVMGKVNREGWSKDRPMSHRHSTHPGGTGARKVSPRARQRPTLAFGRLAAGQNGARRGSEGAPAAGEGRELGWGGLTTPELPEAILEPTGPRGAGEAVLALGPESCRWPCGEPAAPDFGFCGRHAPDGRYCQGHTFRAAVPGSAGRLRGY